MIPDGTVPCAGIPGRTRRASPLTEFGKNGTMKPKANMPESGLMSSHLTSGRHVLKSKVLSWHRFQ